MTPSQENTENRNHRPEDERNWTFWEDSRITITDCKLLEIPKDNGNSGRKMRSLNRFAAWEMIVIVTQLLRWLPTKPQLILFVPHAWYDPNIIQRETKRDNERTPGTKQGTKKRNQRTREIKLGNKKCNQRIRRTKRNIKKRNQRIRQRNRGTKCVINEHKG